MRLEGCGMAEAIRRLGKGSADKVSFQPLPTASPREDSPLRILGVGEIRHPALIGYLRERGIDPAVAGALCREIHYAVGERRFFPSASATTPEVGSCAARSSRGAAPRKPSQPSTDTATLTYLFKTGKLVAEFLHHQLGKVDELFFIRSVAVEAVALRVVLPCTGKGKCEPFHTEYDIFHGIVGKCFFRVLYIGIDDDQIIRLHRHQIGRASCRERV